MTRTADYVSLHCRGERLDTWVSYSVDSDLMQPADAFELVAAVDGGRDALSADRFRAYREQLSPGSLVELYIGEDVSGQRRDRYLQLTGRIDRLGIENTRDGGTVLRVTGRDRAAHLVDSTVPPGLVRDEGTSFVELVEAAVGPWGIPVITDATASRDILTGRHLTTSRERLQEQEARAQGVPASAFSRSARRRAEREGRPLDEALGVEASDRARRGRSNGLVSSDVQRLTARQAAPRAGESVWEFLSRHAQRLGLMLWMSPRGQLIVGAPHYDQEPLYRFVRRWRSRSDDPNNIIAGERSIDGADRLSEVIIVGRAGREGYDFVPVNGPQVTYDPIEAVRVTVTDDAVTFPRRLIIHDRSIRTNEEAERRARREMQMRIADADVLQLEMPDHGLGRYLYAIDTIARLDDEITGARGRWYTIRRTFTKSRDDGTRTKLVLVPSGAIVL